MEWERNENRVLLRGVVEETPCFSHESRGQRFETFPLSVERLSGAVDCLPILCEEALAGTVRRKRRLEVRGELRSFNNKSGQGRRLILSIFAKSLEETTGEFENELHLEGVLCKTPIFRRTPLGREICDFILAVNRRYGRADYLPCIAWGRLAEGVAAQPVGSRLCLEGRMQSRTYRKVCGDVMEERTAFEVSVMRLAPEEVAQAVPLYPAELI